jgi:hypothetical protein
MRSQSFDTYLSDFELSAVAAAPTSVSGRDKEGAEWPQTINVHHAIL